MQKYREHPSRAERQYPVIWGQVERRAYTLLDSFSITVREFDIDDALERIHVARLLDGAWFDDPNEILGDRVVIDLRHLTGWVNQSGLETDHPRHADDKDDRFSVVTARTLPSRAGQPASQVLHSRRLRRHGRRRTLAPCRREVPHRTVPHHGHPVQRQHVPRDRIMNVSAALDSFDKVRRSTGKWVPYGERLRHCVDLAGQPFLDLIGQDSAQWAETATNTRDDLAHHRERFRLEGSVGEHLRAEQLFWLFAMCMLRLAEAPTAVFGGIGNHAQVRWLREQGHEEPI